MLGIGLGRWAVNIHETGGRHSQCCRRASVVWAVSWVAMRDSRLYRWRPPVVTRGSQAVYAKFLKGADVFEHEPIKCVDLGVLHNLTEVYLESVFLCKL